MASDQAYLPAPEFQRREEVGTGCAKRHGLCMPAAIQLTKGKEDARNGFGAFLFPFFS